MRGSRRMIEPPEVRAELVNLGVPTADCERPVMPMCGPWEPVYLCTCLYVANVGGDRQFIFVVPIEHGIGELVLCGRVWRRVCECLI